MAACTATKKPAALVRSSESAQLYRVTPTWTWSSSCSKAPEAPGAALGRQRPELIPASRSTGARVPQYPSMDPAIPRDLLLACQSKFSTLSCAPGTLARAARTPFWKCSESMSSPLRSMAHRRRLTITMGPSPPPGPAQRSPAAAPSRGSTPKYSRTRRRK